MIDNAVWNLGGTADYINSSNGFASHFYDNERGDTVYTGRPTTWTGQIGLMYPSDYGFSTSGGSTTNRSSCLATVLYGWSDAEDCYTNSWLYDSSTTQWTLTHVASDSENVFGVYNSGYVLASMIAYDSNAVRPTLYLSPTVEIASGIGTSTDPYILS